MSDPSKLPHPEQIFELAQRVPLVRAFVMEWRIGNLTWDQMLIGLVTALNRQVDSFAEMAIRSARQNPPPFIVAGMSAEELAAHRGG